MSEASGFVALMAPVGPVAEAFVRDESLICGIMGPFGSAKTTSAIRKMVMSCGLQRPDPRDGVRRARWCVVRDTYDQLETNVMKSWFSWFPKDSGDYNGRERRHTVKIDMVTLGGATERWELEVLFRAMGDLKAEDVLKGLELTGLWLNETDTLDRSVLTFGIGRIGRYPAAKNGGCAYRAVICDFNAPDIDNWTYDLLVEQNLPLDEAAQASLREALGERFKIAFHRQPGGREENAENLANLEAGYYEQMMIGMPAHHISRFVDNQFGAVRNGQPVYPEYNDKIHCPAEPLTAAKNLPVCIGIDGGTTPAAVFGQHDDLGRVRWVSELVVFKPENDGVLEQMGAETFGRLLGEFWLEHFSKHEFGGAWGDPAAWFGQEDEYSWISLMWAEFRRTVGITAARWKISPAPCNGNRLPERLEAVRRPMKQMVAGEPAFQVSSTCRMIRRGFNNGYVILRVQLSAGMGRYQDKPAKNDYSHVQDAGQYLNLGMMRKRRQPGTPAGSPHRRQKTPKKANFGTGAFAFRGR